MEWNLKEGINFSLEAMVGRGETAKAYGSGDLEVLATPAMIALMENAAKSCIQSELPKGYTTVGIEMNVKHSRATPMGMMVTAVAVLERIEGKRLYFSVIASDEKGTVGQGTHVRYIVNSEEFMSRLIQ
ncbi:MAG: thioesterase family protein [Bacillota bacterium]|nr:thioesterase family protein [Bacillota bacterium]